MATGERGATRTNWEARFRVPYTLWARVAALAPTRGLVASNVSGTYQIHPWHVGAALLDPVTSVPSGKSDGLLSPDGGWVVWHEDAAGDERGHFVAVPWPGGERRTVAPDAAASYAPFMGARFSPSGTVFAAPVLDGPTWRVLLVPWGPDGPGEAQLVDTGPGFVSDLAPHDSGMLAYATTGEEGSLTTAVRIIAAAGAVPIREIRHEGASVATVSFASDRSGRLLASTTRSGRLRPLIVEPDGTEREYPLPDVPGDLKPTDWSRDGRSVLLVGSHRSVTRLSTLDVEAGTWREIDHRRGALGFYLPAGAATFVGARGVVTTIEDGTSPPEMIEVDIGTGAVTRTLFAAPPGPLSRPWRSIDIPSTDGAVVQGWLTTPPGAGPFPTIVDVHGGPAAQENDRYFPQAQAWVDRGYAVIEVNYRGSSGFGRDYEQSIWGDPGRREVDDMSAARELLVREGIADPGAVVVTGFSYGGFLTLLALAVRPELWAAGVAYAAIGDWTLMYEEGELLRGFDEGLFTGSPDLRPEAYSRASPLTHVAGLQAPLLIIQGRNDPRCPPRQIEAFVDAARALGQPVEIHWFDAGHGHGAIEERIEWQRRAMDFVDHALGRAG